jgi:hypothetical protein
MLLAAILVGPPAPPTPQDVAAEHARILRGTAADAVVLSVGAGLDLASTQYALDRCQTCYEANPLMRDPGARYALKVASTAAAVWVCYELRRTGHHKAATTLRWALFAALVGVATNNYLQATR